MREKLTPAQAKIVLQLSLSPLAWVGFDDTINPRFRVILPKTGGLFGFHVQEKTRDVLLRKGIIKHGPLSADQIEEYRTRANKESARGSIPSHGYLFKGFQENG